ncbi:hypothetical protein ABZP36_003232 [Zizania latifolia]
MIRKISYNSQPEFEGSEFLKGKEHRWRVAVMIPGGRTDLPTMEYKGEGVDFRVAVQVASFWALLDLRHTHDKKLRNTVFRCHPSRPEGEPFSTFHDTEQEEDTTIIHMARMMESMDDVYTLQEHESRREALA